MDLDGHRAAFLWGPRRTGKSTLLRQQFRGARFYDLLDTELKTRLELRPKILREEVLAAPERTVIVDEVQKVPALLDEVHWLIENTSKRYVLCGSSARKLRHGAGNLLGGRAWRYELFPLTTHELGSRFDLGRALDFGLVPDHFLGSRPERGLRSYVVDYLEQEIRAEGLTRSLPAFARFLESAALGQGGLLNYATVARDCGVAAKTVRDYYQILEDTLIGHRLEPWHKTKRRRLIETAKFYLFDLGLVRQLRAQPHVEPGTAEFGAAFEHFLIEEVRSWSAYSETHADLSYWRTSTGLEVDLIVGKLELALEFKATRHVDARDTKGLRALMEDQRVRRSAIVSLDPTPRRLEGGIEVWPWAEFCRRLWAGDLI